MFVRKSVQVSNRNANADFVISSVDAYAEDVAHRLARYDAQLPPDRQLGEVGLKRFLIWSRDMLEHQNQRLTGAEMAYVRAQAVIGHSRAHRDEKHERLQIRLSAVRTRVEGGLGAETLAQYGLSDRPPRNPEAAVAYASVCIQLLRDYPQSFIDDLGEPTDTQVLAGILEEDHECLRQALVEVQRDKRRLDAAMLHRNGVLDEWHEFYRGFAGVLTHIYAMAGRADLAERMEPTLRRMRGNQGPETSPDLDSDDEAAVEAAVEAAIEAAIEADAEVTAEVTADAEVTAEVTAAGAPVAEELDVIEPVSTGDRDPVAA
jgi:hypothetical protein